MKTIIDIPEKTNAHIRSDYGHGVKGLRDEDREILCDAIYHGTPYEERPHGEWIENTRYKRKGKKFLDCSRCHYGENGDIICEVSKLPNFCPNCGAKMRKEGEAE